MDELPAYLFHHLLEVLRRDLRRERLASSVANPGSASAVFHGVNARLSCEVLQVLNPKRPRKADACQSADAGTVDFDALSRIHYSRKQAA